MIRSINIHLFIKYNIMNKSKESYYNILGIKKNATQIDIRNAYDIKSIKLNPDINNKMESNRRFMDVGNAYQVLSDIVIRKKYDIVMKNNKKFVFQFKDPFIVFDEFQQIKQQVKNNLDKNLNDILCQIEPQINYEWKPKFQNVVLSKELIFINNNPFEKIIEQSIEGMVFVTYVHSNGLRQTIMDNNDLDQTIDNALKI
jgi:curved DNA-binding protein CbpA